MEPAQVVTTNYASEKPAMNWGSWNTGKWIKLVIGLVIAIILWIWLSSPMIVTVTGSGQASVPATNATISFTLSGTDNTASGAVTSVQGKADAMENYLKTKGFAQGDVARSQVTAVPASLVTAGATGFQATISMAAKTTDVAGIPVLIPNLYSNGALVVAQPVLSVENQDVLDQQAFDSAMSDANSQAGKIGNSNWRFIRRIVSISQVSSPTTSTSTVKTDTSLNGVFKIVKAVSVSYKMW